MKSWTAKFVLHEGRSQKYKLKPNYVDTPCVKSSYIQKVQYYDLLVSPVIGPYEPDTYMDCCDAMQLNCPPLPSGGFDQCYLVGIETINVARGATIPVDHKYPTFDGFILICDPGVSVESDCDWDEFDSWESSRCGSDDKNAPDGVFGSFIDSHRELVASKGDSYTSIFFVGESTDIEKIHIVGLKRQNDIEVIMENVASFSADGIKYGTTAIDNFQLVLCCCANDSGCEVQIATLDGVKTISDDWICGGLGVFGGGMLGEDSTYYTTIDYVTINTPSNASDFGDLTAARDSLSACSNGTNGRGVFGEGANFASGNPFVMDYITISSPGNASDFGDLTVARYGSAACSNGTNDRGVFGGGFNLSSGYEDTIDYITISSPGNASDFGDLTVARDSLSACSNGTNGRGVFGGGRIDSGYEDTIDYITISSPGNATDFGDLTVARNGLAACSNGTNGRGVFGGGKSAEYWKCIDYITINTPGNAISSGSLSDERGLLAACSNGIEDRAVFGGGVDGDVDTVDIIEYNTISTNSAVVDFGDLTVRRNSLAACSDA